MRIALLLVCGTTLAAADPASWGQLFQNGRFFDLRRALEPASDNAGTLFFRGAIACRFGRETAGIPLLRQFLGGQPPEAQARRAYEEIAAALARLGRYGEAGEAWNEALRLTPADDPDRDGNYNTRWLLDSLREVAPQTVELAENAHAQATHNSLGSWNVPVRVQGVEGDWIFDTGANISTVTESEARRIGLTVRDSKAYVGGSTGQKNALRLAVADDLQIGGVRVHHVILLVLADEALHIRPVHYQINGILGLPVLRALGRIEISAAGALRIRPPAHSAAGPNLFFEEQSPIVEIEHGSRRLQMFLDTGANATVLYPSFRQAMSRDETAKIRTRKEKTAGAGRVLQRKTQMLPTLTLALAGTAIDLSKVSLLTDMPQSGRFRDGVIGMDALWKGFRLDFDAMRLELSAAQ